MNAYSATQLCDHILDIIVALPDDTWEKAPAFFTETQQTVEDILEDVQTSHHIDQRTADWLKKRHKAINKWVR